MTAYLIARGSLRAPQYLTQIQEDGKPKTSPHSGEGIHFQTLQDARAVCELVEQIRADLGAWRILTAKDRCNRLK